MQILVDVPFIYSKLLVVEQLIYNMLTQQRHCSPAKLNNCMKLFFSSIIEATQLLHHVHPRHCFELEAEKEKENVLDAGDSVQLLMTPLKDQEAVAVRGYYGNHGE